MKTIVKNKYQWDALEDCIKKDGTHKYSLISQESTLQENIDNANNVNKLLMGEEVEVNLYHK